MKNPIYDTVDNCLLCKHADIRENEFAKWLKRIGLGFIGNKLAAFPVVMCKLTDGKYVANPMKRPGWCKRGSR